MKNPVKQILKVVCILCILFGGLKLAGPLFVNILYLFLRPDWNFSVSETASIGIIGGADGPTSILVAVSPWGSYILPILLLITGFLGLHFLKKKG